MKAGPADAAEVEETIRRRVTEQAATWFTGVDAAPIVRLHRLAERPRALLYAVSLGDEQAPRLLAKIRRDWPTGTGAPSAGARPRLTSDFLPAAEQTELEFRGLTAIAGMVGTSDIDFAVVRPLDHLVAENAILMDYVDARTLRDVVVRGNRFSPGRWRAASRCPRDVWRRTGAWLRLFHQQPPPEGLPARQHHRDDVVALFHSFGEYLGRRLGPGAVGDVARRGAALAADVLPAELPLVVGHGDFAPRNVFVLDGGRIAVFDPLPRWLVPRFEDLCRFLVNLRLQGLPLHTHGLADGARALDLRERDVIEGYRGGEALDMAQLRCLQLLITLDKWSTHAQALGGSRFDVVHRARDASLRLASGYVRAEARRLLDLVAAD
jgi:hypothetical protein